MPIMFPGGCGIVLKPRIVRGLASIEQREKFRDIPIRVTGNIVGRVENED